MRRWSSRRIVSPRLYVVAAVSVLVLASTTAVVLIRRDSSRDDWAPGDSVTIRPSDGRAPSKPPSPTGGRVIEKTPSAAMPDSAGPDSAGPDSAGPDSAAPDWAVAMVRSTMDRHSPTTIGGWRYPVGLYLYGQYLVYQRTGDRAELSYIKSWVDRFVDGGGNLGPSIDHLDAMMSGRVLLALYRETGQDRYRIAAAKIRDRFATYPRTSDGGFWHVATGSRGGQLWADGVFMSTPFLAEYGRDVGDREYAWNEATKQLLVYASHLQTSNGLPRHAYSERRDQSWSDRETGLAPEHWCRAVGWFGMATVQVLDIIPASHPRRDALVTVVADLVRGLAAHQDPVTGRWFQVMDKGRRADNWTETSCSSMHTYVIDRAVEKGYVKATYLTNADRGFQGVLDKISLGRDGRTYLADVCPGTGVGNYAHYVRRPRVTNDLHGLGAFLLMYEQLRPGP
jgi:unsaturated rhamnogalacturonyl hydrolase